MKIYYTQNHQQHHPQSEFFNGEREEHAEVPQRLENILSSLTDHGYKATPVDSVDSENEVRQALSQIHDNGYLDWLENVRPEGPVYPSVFNVGEQNADRGHLSIQWGNFVTDMFTPLMPDTFKVALRTAGGVYQAVQNLIDNSETSVMLGRPPGHHAGRSRVGGYCYFNNAALAAQLLSSHGRVATLDVDYHHGNGTQDIFYDRSDVVTCSIHADPVRKFPYFAGMQDEVGIDDGEGFNLNFALEAGVTNQRYQEVLVQAVSWIEQHDPQFIVVSLGLDTHESDPIADFKLTTEYYHQMASTINNLGLPTVIVLEGGYSTGAIGENVVSFLSGMNG